MAKSIKIKVGEKLDEANVRAVIKALKADKPISKKEACNMLNITYNTTRLKNIIEDLEAKIVFRRKQRAAVRKTEVSTMDKQSIVQSFVAGDALGEIVKNSYRSLKVVKDILAAYSLPFRAVADSRVLIEEEQTSSNYSKGDLVWSAKYNAYAEIVKRLGDNEEGAVYHIYILGDNGQNAAQPFFELIDLRKAQRELTLNLTSPVGIAARALPKEFA